MNETTALSQIAAAFNFSFNEYQWLKSQKDKTSEDLIKYNKYIKYVINATLAWNAFYTAYVDQVKDLQPFKEQLNGTATEIEKSFTKYFENYKPINIEELKQIFKDDTTGILADLGIVS